MAIERLTVELGERKGLQTGTGTASKDDGKNTLQALISRRRWK